jgi:4-hydroxyphenylpyruvate dioxygenase
MKDQPMVDFFTTPAAYYDYMPERLVKTGILRIDEDIRDLHENGILLDGGAEHSYMLQIFMKEKGTLMNDPKAGPFFYELIQRKGDKGFGGGNFRALFESIERAQRETGRL